IVAGALSLCAAVLAWRPKQAALIACGLTVAASSALAAGVYSFDHHTSTLVRSQLLPPDREWVDHTGLRNVAMLLPPHSTRDGARQQLLWNRTITDVLLLGADEIDSYRQEDLRVSRDGRLVVDGSTVTQALLVQTYGSRVALTGVTKIAGGPLY